MRRALATSLTMLALVAPAAARPKPQKPTKQTPEQKEADKHFKSGVALFKEQKYSEALAEFERAYELAPHPLVLYNIAGCHRELSHYAEAVKFYNRFLDEGKSKVADKLLGAAQAELDGILARIARITVVATPTDGTSLSLDGQPLGTFPLDMPIVLAPGEHKLVAKAPGRRDAERTVRVASGDEVEIALSLPEAPKEVLHEEVRHEQPAVVVPLAKPSKPKRFGIGAAFGTNLRLVGDTGAPALGFSVAVASRIELGIDATLVAYSVSPVMRIRLAGDATSVYAALSVPVAFNDGAMSETFYSGSAGLGVRLRPVPAVALKIETFASYSGSRHGINFPAFVGGELWF